MQQLNLNTIEMKLTWKIELSSYAKKTPAVASLHKPIIPLDTDSDA